MLKLIFYRATASKFITKYPLGVGYFRLEKPDFHNRR
jgi:hypothetical protein